MRNASGDDEMRTGLEEMRQLEASVARALEAALEHRDPTEYRALLRRLAAKRLEVSERFAKLTRERSNGSR